MTSPLGISKWRNIEIRPIRIIRIRKSQLFQDHAINGCPLIIETDFDIAFNKFIAVGSS